MMLIKLSFVVLCAIDIPIINALCDDTVKQTLGYLDGGSDAQLFYWFFESRGPGGGPGGSSMYALVSGNGGPCILNRDGNSTSLNEYSYNTFANVLYLDQPASTGFSKGKIPKNSVEAATASLRALEFFFAKHPRYNTEVFFIGQSYAGEGSGLDHQCATHALLALAINDICKSLIKLRGVILGNSGVNDMLQYISMPTMGYSSGTTRSVLTETEYQLMLKALRRLLSDMQSCLDNKDRKKLCKKASDDSLSDMLQPIRRKNIDLFDLRLQCTEPAPGCQYRKNFAVYFNSREVQQYLKVKTKWILSNTKVFDAFISDFPVDYSPHLAMLLNEGLRVMIYAGDQDYMCNWIGSRDMASDIPWSGRDGFSKAPDTLYSLPSGKQIGKLRIFTSAATGGQLSFAQIFEAGHSAAKDSPEGVLQLVSDFALGRLV
ncbi:hypothetical protein FOL47_008356 [Perkinsus chesapeaki]|uniref:Thymus-specific serine protease n=1 Tax=Perkinsus chesapeaki TaxID=330153 RepID=A0A7J6MTX0_PERCH|nr:hypothetical protein FOL47_008356 [Perkinsus chesapeaki]